MKTPSSSIDTYLACTVVIILVLAAMAGESTLFGPYIGSLSHGNDDARFQTLALNLLTSAGAPVNWGQSETAALTSVGLAKAGSSLPYELDIDKVSRLNNANAYSVAYSELWEKLGVQDVAFQIKVKTLFDLTTRLVSNSTIGSETRCVFDVSAVKSGLPVAAELSVYAVAVDFVAHVSSSTSAGGAGAFEVEVPNSVEGPVLIIVLAKATVNPQVVSFNVYSFSLGSSASFPAGTFARLSPLSYVLNASFVDADTQVQSARMFTFDYNFSLAEKARAAQSVEYVIPRVLGSGPMMTVLTGYNGSAYFAEWAAYPQVPLQCGSNFSDSTAGSRVVSFSQPVTIDGALYEVQTSWGGTR